MTSPLRQPADGPSALPAPPASAPESVPILGIPLALTDYKGSMDHMDAAISRSERIMVSAAAVHLVMVSQERPEIREAALRTFNVADGQPLVWAMRSLGHEASRVYGPTLMLRYCERCAEQGTRIFLYGGRNRGALVQLVDSLRRRFPGIRIVGGHSPPFRPSTEDETEAIVAEINGSGADVVWVGVGQPKQEEWMAAMRDRLDAPVLIGVGAAFDFHAGLVPQAPAWMQRGGLEWTYRLVHEPRRLWRRYARYNPRFVVGFSRQWARERLGRSRSR
jgi:N-acetylglucosaminyldiphosphoundecaprenol N-acetyl-beta-D-mannosaminyltransferase